jgi:hypothetical protein
MMGVKLATAAYTWWTHIPDRPFRLLVHMCLIAKDTDDNPKFYGAREQMILALGLPDAPTSDQMVSRAVRQLLDSGALVRATNARFGRRAEFWVRVKNRPQLDSTVKQSLTPESSNSLTPESKQVDPSGKHRLTPQSTQGVLLKPSTQENGEEETSSRNSGVPRATQPVRGKADESRLALVRKHADDEAAS